MSLGYQILSALSGVTVKEGRHDEAENNEMAPKIKETHRQASAKTAAAQIVDATARVPTRLTNAANGQL